MREPDAAGTAAQHSGQSFFKAGCDDNCFHTALYEEFSPKIGDISDRKPALDPRFVLLGRILQFPSKPPSSPMVGPIPDERRRTQAATNTGSDALCPKFDEEACAPLWFKISVLPHLAQGSATQSW